ncbi:unnamed protein product [Cyclocybe aegerita]|uniref:Uncharacterized protein n=1 Tax=Cyclocybe aegerita TaxID=1973307 RepID=A0A8S0X0L1_CYCAE|nr:unnamed protein product [Cyclocybe aegerita]
MSGHCKRSRMAESSSDEADDDMSVDEEVPATSKRSASVSKKMRGSLAATVVTQAGKKACTASGTRALSGASAASALLKNSAKNHTAAIHETSKGLRKGRRVSDNPPALGKGAKSKKGRAKQEADSGDKDSLVIRIGNIVFLYHGVTERESEDEGAASDTSLDVMRGQYVIQNPPNGTPNDIVDSYIHMRLAKSDHWVGFEFDSTMSHEAVEAWLAGHFPELLEFFSTLPTVRNLSSSADSPSYVPQWLLCRKQGWYIHKDYKIMPGCPYPNGDDILQQVGKSDGTKFRALFLVLTTVDPVPRSIRKTWISKAGLIVPELGASSSAQPAQPAFNDGDSSVGKAMEEFDKGLTALLPSLSQHHCGALSMG